MIAWFWKLIVGSFHQHVWETMETGNLRVEGRVSGQKVFLRCTKCGEWKTLDLL